MSTGYVVVTAIVIVIIILLAVVGSLKAVRSARVCLRRRKVEYLIDEDISNGREMHELPAISYRRHDESPLDFHYVTDHVKLDPDIQVDTSLMNMTCCNCVGDCSHDDCVCSKGTQCKRFYNSRGQLSDDFKLDAPEMIRECNMACKCNRKMCTNMVIQRGCQAKLVLFRTKTRGWGVRTLTDLKRGTFIGIYSGELVSVASSQRRDDDTYLFNLSNGSSRPETRIEIDEASGSEQTNQDEEKVELNKKEETKGGQNNLFVCDAKFYGNFTRFINHSCEPNVVGIRTFTSHQDDRFPHISFFTNQDIPAGTELTLNYGDTYWLVKCKRDKVYCLCRRSKCKFNSRTLPITTKQYQESQQSRS
jgi:euchromatic histone-lysine N-methyltransferase